MIKLSLFSIMLLVFSSSVFAQFGVVIQSPVSFSGGSSTFLGLTDTPNSYTGQDGKVCMVNETSGQIVFASVSGTGTVTSVNAGTRYLYTSVPGAITSAGTIYLNETELNQTIDARQTGGGNFTGNVEFINFSQTPTIDCDNATQGQLFYSADNKALSYKLNEVCLQIGEEEYITIVNKLGETILNGKVVYINGAQGNRPTVNYTTASQEYRSYSIGMATQDILNNEEGKITTFGLVHNLDTSAWVEGTPLFLSTQYGNLTSVRPIAPNHGNFFGVVVTQHATQGVILARPSSGYELY